MSRSTEHFDNNTSPRSLSRGEDLAIRFQTLRNALLRMPHPLARVLPSVKGLKSSGKFLEGQENMLLKIGEILRDSRAVYRYGADILYVINVVTETIMDAFGVNRSAPAILANLMVFQEANKANGWVEFLAPSSVLDAVFRNRTVLEMLPSISYIAKMPVYGPDFMLLQGPGYHNTCGIMVLV